MSDREALEAAAVYVGRVEDAHPLVTKNDPTANARLISLLRLDENVLVGSDPKRIDGQRFEPVLFGFAFTALASPSETKPAHCSRFALRSAMRSIMS